MATEQIPQQTSVAATCVGCGAHIRAMPDDIMICQTCRTWDEIGKHIAEAKRMLQGLQGLQGDPE